MFFLIGVCITAKTDDKILNMEKTYDFSSFFQVPASVCESSLTLGSTLSGLHCGKA